jgi:hypothetical protein
MSQNALIVGCLRQNQGKTRKKSFSSPNFSSKKTFFALFLPCFQGKKQGNFKAFSKVFPSLWKAHACVR